MELLDRYSRNARLFPALIGLIPVMATLVVGVPWTTGPVAPIGGTLFMLAVLHIAADLTRRLGRRAEQRLFDCSQGKPTSMVLAYDDPSIDAQSKDRYRAFLDRKLGLDGPTVEEERENPLTVFEYYERCSGWLRERTRDTQRFGLLLSENITYGFRRNLYGLKAPALAVDTMILVGATALIAAGPPSFLRHVSEAEAYVLLGLTLLHALYFLFGVTKAAVLEASEQYARQLVLCCELLMER